LSRVPALKTSSHPFEDEWSEEKLPEILFYLIAPDSKYFGKPVRSLLDASGQVILSDRRKPIRDFEVLPRHISLDVPGK
jgi:hypothetical protein